MLFRIYFFYLKDNHNHPKNSRLKNIFGTLVWVFKSLTLRNLFAIKFSFDRETRELILYLDQKALSRIKTEQKCLTFVFVPQRLYGALLTSLIFSYGISITTWYSINSDKNYLKNKRNKVIRTFVSLDGDVSHQICQKLLDQSYEYSHKIVLSHYWLMYQILKALRSSIEMWWHLIAALCWLLTVIYCNLETLNQTLQAKSLPVSEAELRWIPNNTIEVTDGEQARSLLKLIDALESLDDVQNVTANFEMADQLMSVSMV